jgi:formylglycine-generating enzyme required for sulfatase activity
VRNCGGTVRHERESAHAAAAISAMNDLDSTTLPAGSFMMGAEAEAEEEAPRHEVGIAAFECMLYPVTRRLWSKVAKFDPASRLVEFAKGNAYWESVQHLRNEPDAQPAPWVRWYEAIGFCNALSHARGLRPCYVVSGRFSPTSAAGSVAWDRTADGYRLPTEAEWEYACRAGTGSKWSHGDDESTLGQYAWYRDNSNNRTQPVGQKRPNPWGLFDMHGNVDEWCYDAPRTYAAAAERDPMGDMTSNRRVLRGGSALAPAHSLRSSARGSTVLSKVGLCLGLRCVRSIG